ncbi:MAG: MMPL family transporter [Proteobacteria bacterium]|nr:MMPL family transporter [Pseudomonadota bacterium]
MPTSPSSDYITRMSQVFARIAGWSFDHRWFVLAFCLAIGAGAMLMAAQARIDNSYESFFNPDDPAYVAYEKFREDFGSDEVAYVMYEAPEFEHGPWNLEVMRKVAHLTRALEDEVPFIYEVTSLTNAELIEGVDDGIEIRELWEEPPETQAALIDARGKFLNKPMYIDSLLSRDARYGAISIEMDLSSTDPLEMIRLDPEGGDGYENLYPQVSFHKIEEILARPEYAGLRFDHSGDVPLNSFYNMIIDQESGLPITSFFSVVFERESPSLPLISSMVIAVVMALFFRSVVGVLGPIVVVQLSILMAVVLIVLLDWRLDMMFGSVPNLLTAIGVAHSVHILSEFRALHAEMGDRRAALCRALYLVGPPCLLASLTTATGFLAMAVSPIKGLSHMAVYSSVGVLAAFVLSITLLMTFLSFGRNAPRRAADPQAQARAKGGLWMARALTAVGRFDIRHRRAILAGSLLVFAFSGWGIARLTVDSNWMEDFSDRVPLKAATSRIDEVMGGMANIVYLFDTGEPDGVKDPAVLREIERLQREAEKHDWLVKKTHSLVDILKDLNQAFHEGDPAYYRIPESRELVAQYLLMYESSGGDEAEEFVSGDYSRTNLELRLRITETSHTAKLVDSLDAYLAEKPLEHSSVSLTGIGALWLILLDYITASQIGGFTLAFGVIALMMIAIFRSLKIGLISMVPNLSPVFLTLGAMGWLGIPLDYSKVMIATVAIGIAVDDTIHMVSRYHHEFLRTGSYHEALLEAMRDVGRALFITSVALVLGFLVFALSLLDSEANFGYLLATTITAALVADFLLMPALVMTFHPFGPEGARAGEMEDAA